MTEPTGLDSSTGALPAGVDRPTRLELGAAGFGGHGDLWRAGAEWLRTGGAGAEALGTALEAIEPLLSRSFLLGQPNLAGMGVAAWDLAVATPGEALVARQAERARRMVGKSPIARFEDEADETRRADDAQALQRGADLLEAIQQLDAAAAALPEEAPDSLRHQVARLRGALTTRLDRERRHHRTLDRALRRLPADGGDASAHLRRQPPEAEPALARTTAPTDPYQGALEAVLVREVPAEATIERVAQAALAAPADSARARQLTERARRLFAEEVARGTVTPQTLELRRALADRPAAGPRPTEGAHTPIAGAPEVPVRSSRGEKARTIGYLRAGERIDGEARGAHVRVVLPGGRTGWIPAHLLTSTTAPRPTLAPARPGLGAPGLVAPGPELTRLAALVAQETGRSTAAVLAQALQDPAAFERGELARELATPRPRRDRGEAMAAPAGGPLHIERVAVEGLAGNPETARVVDAALTRLPHVLERRLADAAVRGRLQGSTGEVQVKLQVERGGDLRVQADILADRMADALVRAQAAQVETLRLGVRTTGGLDLAPERALLARLAGEDVQGIAAELAAERKELDATQQSRLARFFGEEFKDVLIFAGPMAGALARSLDAEAITHGRMIFFDPTHFRPDSPHGEALLAHELAHTRQADDRDVKHKEAEALATEAAYLDWVKPGDAPFTYALDVTAPAAAAAGDVAPGIQRATPNRTAEQTEGPRKEIAQEEKKVEVLLQAVRELLGQDTDFEGQRLGALRRIINRLV